MFAQADIVVMDGLVVAIGVLKVEPKEEEQEQVLDVKRVLEVFVAVHMDHGVEEIQAVAHKIELFTTNK